MIGGFPERVTLTCFQCGEDFKVIVQGEYEGQPWCPRCIVEWDAAQETKKRREPTR